MQAHDLGVRTASETQYCVSRNASLHAPSGDRTKTRGTVSPVCRYTALFSLEEGASSYVLPPFRFFLFVSCIALIYELEAPLELGYLEPVWMLRMFMRHIPVPGNPPDAPDKGGK